MNHRGDWKRVRYYCCTILKFTAEMYCKKYAPHGVIAVFVELLYSTPLQTDGAVGLSKPHNRVLKIGRKPKSLLQNCTYQVMYWSYLCID